MVTRRYICVIAVAFALLGCVSLPEIPYDRMSAGDIKTVVIVTPSFPKDASVILASSPGQSFGLVGALVDAGLQANRENRFRAVLTQRHFDARGVFLERLSQELEMRGYAVAAADAERPRSEFLDKYPANGNADAYLDLVVSTYGYIAAGVGGSTPYRPQFSVKARLIRAGDSSVLMQDTILYNPYNPAVGTPKAVTIAPLATYEFETFDLLESNAGSAVEGLQDAAWQSASAIANLIN